MFEYFLNFGIDKLSLSQKFEIDNLIEVGLNGNKKLKNKNTK